MVRKSSKRASRKSSRRKLSDWQKFVKSYKGKGKTLKQLSVLYKKPSKKASRKGSRKGSKKRSKKSNCVAKGGSKHCPSGKVCDASTKRCRAPKKRGRKASKKASRKASKKRSRKASKKASKKASRKASKKRSRKSGKKLGKNQARCLVEKKAVEIIGGKYVKSKSVRGRITYRIVGKDKKGHNLSKIVSKDEYSKKMD